MATFLQEVLSAGGRRGTASADEFRDMLSSVEGKLESLKLELVEALQSCFVATDGDVDRVSSRLDELKTLDEDISGLLDDISREKTTMAMSEEELSTVLAELDECERNIELLHTLVRIVQNLEKAEVEVDFVMASKRLNTCEKDFAQITRRFSGSEDNVWIRALKTSINEKLKENYDRALKEWNSKFHFGKATLIVDPYSNFSSLIETFKNINYFTSVWEKFCTLIWMELLSKVCSPIYSIRIQEGNSPPDKQRRKSCQASNSIEKIEDVSPEIGCIKVELPDDLVSPPDKRDILKTVIKVRPLEKPITIAEDVFRNILTLVTALHNMFEGDESLMQDLSEVVGSKLVSHLMKGCLKSLILEQSGGNKQRAIEDVVQLRELRENLTELGFKLSDESETILDEFETNFDGLFMNQLREDVLAKIRKLIKSDVHQTIHIDPKDITPRDKISPDEMRKEQFLHEGYKISVPVFEIVEVLKEHFKKYPNDSILIENAFNLFISIVAIPKTENESSDFIPLTSILINNNCTYLAHHAELTFPFCEDKISLLRAKGAQAVAFMMRSARTKINGMILAAMSGLEKTSYSNGQSAVKFLSISTELDRLYTVFRDVLPRRVCRQTLAALVDHTVNEMSSKVLSWDDITASCADEVAESFTKFSVAITAIFQKEAPPNTSAQEIDVKISKVVQKWERFRLLAFVLTASMKDIQDKWVNGCGPLSQFTPDEMRKLVRALFQNTDRRAAFLSSIK